jgi:hypothetical protein
MDPTRFDELTRLLMRGLSSPGASRRTLVAAVAAAGFGGFAVRPPLAGARKKKKCRGAKKRCGNACIPDNACCLGRGRWVADGRPHNQCGLCTNGTMLVTLACDSLDPSGCTECNDNFQCVPVPEGTPCDCPDPEECCSCRGGLCEPGCPGGQPCCGGKVCCDEDDGCCGDACCDPCPEERYCFGHGCCDEDEICCGLGTAFQRCCEPGRCVDDRCCLSGYCGPGICARDDEECCFSGSRGWACPVPGDCCLGLAGVDKCCPGERQACFNCAPFPNPPQLVCCDRDTPCESCTDPVAGRTA